jgi:adenylate cyclase
MDEAGGKVKGGCLCGAIRYESDHPPFEAGYCHCQMCQKGLGNLFGAWVFIKHEDFRFTSGNPLWYKSSEIAKRGFCATCGSPIAYQPVDVDFITIWIGSLDEPAEFEPQAHFWTESRISWADIHSDLPVKGIVFKA